LSFHAYLFGSVRGAALLQSMRFGAVSLREVRAEGTCKKKRTDFSRA
jgi:hypothetical protein